MMELAQRSSPSLWTALLWKEFQQMKQTVAAVAVGLVSIQVMLVLIGFASGPPENKVAAYGGTIQLACVAPILIALGCAGLLIGQERQTGTWAWSSSLPVSWQQALGSKLVVSILCSLVVLIPASIVPLWLHVAGYLAAANSLSVASLGMTLMILLETIVVCFLATLMIKETLNALVVAGAVMIAIEFGVWTLVHSMQDSGFKLTHYDGDLILFSTVAWFFKAVLFGALLMPIAFRWRWGVGQQAVLSVAANTGSMPVASYASYRIQTSKAPSEWQMMLQHSFANSMWLRITTALATLTLALIAPREAMNMILFVSFYLFGISAFDGDQSLSRIRFLADRGVTPWKLVTSRLSIAFSIPVLVMVFLIGVSIAQADLHPVLRTMQIWLVFPISFLTGAFASMCFRKTIVAATLGVVIQAMWFALLILVTEWVQAHAEMASNIGASFWSQILACTPVACIAMLAAIFVLSQRWIIRDGATLGPHFFWITLASLLSPIFLASTFGFLFVPNTPWQDVAIADVSNNSKTSSIDLIEHPFLFDDLEMNLNGLTAAVLNDASVAKQESSKDVMEFIKSLLASPNEDLKPERKLVDLELRYRYFDSSLSHVIVRTAALATICLEKKDPETALRYWHANRDLQEFSRRFDPTWTSTARANSMQMLLSLKEDDVAALGGLNVVHSLIPAAANERTNKIRIQWMNANNLRELYRSSNVTFYPPIRWRAERQLAYFVNHHNMEIPTAPEDYLTGPYRERLLQRYP